MIVSCSGCSSKYNVKAFRPGLKCPKCKSDIVDPSQLAYVSEKKSISSVRRSSITSKVPVKKHGKSSKKLIIFGILLIVVISAISVYFLATNSDKPQAKRPPDKVVKKDEQSKKLELPTQSLQARYDSLVMMQGQFSKYEMYGKWRKLYEDAEREGSELKDSIKQQLQKAKNHLVSATRVKFNEAKDSAEELINQGKYDEALVAIEKFPKEEDIDGIFVPRLEEISQKARSYKEFQPTRESFEKTFKEISDNTEIALKKWHAGGSVDSMSSAKSVLGSLLEELAKYKDSENTDIASEASTMYYKFETLKFVINYPEAVEKRRADSKKVVAEVSDKVNKEISKTAEEVDRINKGVEGKSVELILLYEDIVADAVIKSFKRDLITFSVTKEDKEVVLSEDAIHPLTLAKIYSLSGVDTPEVNYKIGLFYARARNYDDAVKYFDRVKKAKPEMARLIPDIKRLKQIYRLFQKSKSGRLGDGDITRLGQTILCKYDFRRFGLKDFSGSKGWEVKEGSAISKSKESKLVHNLKKFTNKIKASVVVQSNQKFIMRIGNNENSIKFESSPKGSELIVVRNEDVVAKEKLEVSIMKPAYVSVSVENGVVEFLSGPEKKTVKVEGLEKFKNFQVKFIAEGEGSTLIAHPVVIGEIDSKWLTDEFIPFETSIYGELNKSFSGIEGGKKKLLVHEVKTVFDGTMEHLPEGPRSRIEEIKRDISAILDGSSGGSDLEELIKRINGMISSSSVRIPQLHYYLGVLSLETGQIHNAITALKKAVEIEPNFAEAYVMLAKIHMIMGNIEEGEKNLKKAEALYSDFASYFEQKAYSKIYSRVVTSDVLALIGIAKELEPEDLLIHDSKRKIENYVRGPLFSKMFIHEGENFVVKTDISKDRAKYYSDLIESAYVKYRQYSKAKRAPSQKGEALIFSNRTSYLIYSNLTQEFSFAWYTLGVYFPNYDQLLLFDGPDKEEVKQTLIHEAFHRYFKKSVLFTAPIWLDEGFAEFLSDVVTASGKLKGTLKARLEQLVGKDQNDRIIGFKDIMLMPKSEFYNPTVGTFRYGQSWLMIKFFHTSEEYIKVFNDYVDALVEGKTTEDAFNSTFAKVDLKKAEEEWKKFIEGLR